MTKIDRFRSPEEVERLADLKRGVNLVALATERYGLTITEKSRDESAYTLENKAQGERITVKVGPEGYHIYNNHNNDRDKGSVVDFLQQRHPERNLGQVKGMLQEMVPGAKQALDYEKFQAQQVRKAPSAADARYEALPAAERRAAMVRETMGPNPQLTDASYLLERGLSKETVSDPAFKGRVFTDQHSERQERLGQAQRNVGFPFYNEKGVQSWELRNRAPEGETDSFKMMMKAPGDEFGAKNGVWSSNLLAGRGSQPERMVIGESPIDMMSKYQTERAAATEAGQDLPNTRYVATGGTPSIEQKAIIQAIIDREQPRQVILSNDNDAAGQAFNVRYLNDLRPPVAGLSPEQQQEAAAARERTTWIAGDNGKKGEEKLLTMTISFQHGNAKEGRDAVESLRTQAEMRGLPAEEPTASGTAGLQMRRNAPEVTEVVLRVAPEQAAAVVDLARELRREREQAMPEAARTPENYFVVEKATGKDYNQDILQGRAGAQLDAQRREAGFVAAPEMAPAVAPVVAAAPVTGPAPVVVATEQYAPSPQVAARQIAADIDNSGSTSAEEILRADRNRDGLVSGSELDAARFDARQNRERPGEQPSEQKVSGPVAADINLNGSTSQAEILRAGANRDGVVTDTELATARFESNQANERSTADAGGQTEAERQAGIRRRYEEQRQQQAAEQEPQATARDTSGPLRSAAIIIFEAEGLPAGTLTAGSTTLVTLADKMKEAIEGQGSEVNLQPGRDKSTDQPYSMLSFTYHEGSAEHGRIQESLRDAQTQGPTKYFGIEPGVETQRETAPITRTVALTEQPLAIALDAPNPLLESQLRATGATVSNEPVQDRPGLVVVVDTNKGEQLASVEQTLSKLPAAAVVVEGPEATEVRQQLTLAFREQGGMAPALQAEALLPGRIRDDVPERLREAGATVVPANPATRLEAGEGALSVRYPLEQPQVLGRVSVVLDEVNNRSAQVAADLGQVPNASTGSVVETPLAQQTRQLVAREQGMEATPPRGLPERQPTEDRVIDRPRSTVILDAGEQGPVGPKAEAPAVRPISAAPAAHAIERRIIFDVNNEKPGLAPTLEAALTRGGFQVATASIEAVGEEKGGTRIEALYRTTDSVAQRGRQADELAKIGKMSPADVTLRESDAQAREREQALKGPGKPEAGQMVAAGQTLRATITVLEVDGEKDRTTRLWTDLRDAGAKVGHVAKTEISGEGTRYAFPVDYRPSDARLPLVSATLEAAARSEGIQVTETDNMRLERLARSGARESKLLAEMTPAARQEYKRPDDKDYSASRPGAYEQVALVSEDLKTAAGVKALREELKETGAVVAVRQLDGQAANSGAVTLSFAADSPKAGAVNEVLRSAVEKGGTVYDLKAGADRNADGQATAEAAPRGPLTAAQERDANLAELHSLEARRDALRESQREATTRSQLAEQYLLPAAGVAGEVVEARPWVGFGPDLRGEDLRNTDAAGMDLRGADLRGVDLRSTDLRGSDLREANLSGADLRGTNLTGVRLEGAVLEGTNLEGALRVVENGEGKRQIEENLTPAALAGPGRDGPAYPPAVTLDEPRLASAERAAAGEENSPAAAPRLAQVLDPQYSGLSLPTEEEVRRQPLPLAEESTRPLTPAGAPASGTLSPYEELEEAGTRRHAVAIHVTQPAWAEGIERTDRVKEIRDQLTAAGAEMERGTGRTFDERSNTEITVLRLTYAHDAPTLPALSQALEEVARVPTGSDYGVRIEDENAAARVATAGSRMQNTPEAAKALAAELHDGDRSTARLLVTQPALEDVWALEAAGAKVARIYLPDGPAALVSYPAAEPGTTGTVSIELDRIARESSLARPPHNSDERRLSGPLLGEDPAQQESRQGQARAEGLALEPRPRYELNEMSERDARAKAYFREEITQPSELITGKIANGETFKGNLTELLSLGQPDREALQTEWKAGTTTLLLVVQEAPALDRGDGQAAPWPDRVAEALREAGAEARVRALGVSPDTGLEKHVVTVTFDNNNPELGRIQATLGQLAGQDGVRVPTEGYWEREVRRDPNGTAPPAEPVLAVRDRPWLEAVVAISEPTPQERRELTQAGARLENAGMEQIEGHAGKLGVLVYYDLDNPLTVARVSTVLDQAGEQGRLLGETANARDARAGRVEQYQADIRQEKQQEGASPEQLPQKVAGAGAQAENEIAGPLSFADRLRAAVNDQLADIRKGWEAAAPEKVAIYVAEQKGIADRKALEQQQAAEAAAAPQREAEKAAYERGFNGTPTGATPAPEPAKEAGKEKEPGMAPLEPVAAALPGSGGVAAGSNGAAAEVFTDKVLRERRDDERTLPVVVDGAKEGKVLETTEQVKPGIAAQPEQPTGDKAREKDGAAGGPPVAPLVPVAPEVLAPVAKAPEKELQHGIIGMEGTARKSAEDRMEMVRGALLSAGASVEALVPSSRDNREATLAFSYDPQDKQLPAINKVLQDVQASQPSMIKEEPHSLHYAGIKPNTHEIERRDWPERTGQFSKAHIVVDDADHKGQARAENIKGELGNAGVVVGDVQKDGHGHVELKLTYHSQSPHIDQINSTLDKAGNSPGIEVRELDSDRTARYQGAIDQLQAKDTGKERERGE